eukprot:g19267.t2
MRLPSLHQQLSSIPVLSTGTKCPGDFTAVDSILHWLSHGVRMPACIFHQGQACAFIGKDGRLSDNRRQAEFSTGESSSEEFRQVSCRFMSGKVLVLDVSWQLRNDPLMGQKSKVELVVAGRQLNENDITVEAAGVLRASEVQVIFVVPVVNLVRFQGSGMNALELRVLQIPEGTQDLEEGAFADCSSLVEARIPDSVTSIEASAFQNCRRLVELQLPGSLRRIRPSAFCGCSGCFEGWGDGEVSIPRAVTSIQSGAFEACSGLRKVQIPEQVICVGDRAFANCTSLELLELKGRTTQVVCSALEGSPARVESVPVQGPE